MNTIGRSIWLCNIKVWVNKDLKSKDPRKRQYRTFNNVVMKIDEIEKLNHNKTLLSRLGRLHKIRRIREAPEKLKIMSYEKVKYLGESVSK